MNTNLLQSKSKPQSTQINISIPRGDMLYRFTLECAKQKRERTCDMICAACSNNVNNYNVDVQDAIMLQHTADLEYNGRMDRMEQAVLLAHGGTQPQRQKPSGAKVLVATAVVAGLILLGILAFKQQPAAIINVPQTPVPVVVRNETPADVPKDNQQLIRDTLKRVRRIDIDGWKPDSPSCVDFALQFYDLYPGDVRLIRNLNPSTRMNHLFVMVNGQAIEPGAYLEPVTDRWFGMQKYWGSKYDPAYNKDVTPAIDLIRAGKFWEDQQ